MRAVARLALAGLMAFSWSLTRSIAEAEPVTVLAAQQGNCHPSYQGTCIPPNVLDADCAGGTGDGPYFVQEKNIGWSVLTSLIWTVAGRLESVARMTNSVMAPQKPREARRRRQSARRKRQSARRKRQSARRKRQCAQQRRRCVERPQRLRPSSEPWSGRAMTRTVTPLLPPSSWRAALSSWSSTAVDRGSAAKRSRARRGSGPQAPQPRTAELTGRPRLSMWVRRRMSLSGHCAALRVMSSHEPAGDCDGSSPARRARASNPRRRQFGGRRLPAPRAVVPGGAGDGGGWFARFHRVTVRMSLTFTKVAAGEGTTGFPPIEARDTRTATASADIRRTSVATTSVVRTAA